MRVNLTPEPLSPQAFGFASYCMTILHVIQCTTMLVGKERVYMCRLLNCSKNQPQLFQMTSIGKSVIVYNVINDFWSALGTMRLYSSGGSLPPPLSSWESGSQATPRGDRACGGRLDSRTIGRTSKQVLQMLRQNKVEWMRLRKLHATISRSDRV